MDVASPLRDAIQEAVDHSVGGLLEQHREVVDLKVKAVEDKLDANSRAIESKIDAAQWKWAAALAGGQVVAGMVAALITRSPQAQATALDVLSVLPFV